MQLEGLKNSCAGGFLQGLMAENEEKFLERLKELMFVAKKHGYAWWEEAQLHKDITIEAAKKRHQPFPGWGLMLLFTSPGQYAQWNKLLTHVGFEVLKEVNNPVYGLSAEGKVTSTHKVQLWGLELGKYTYKEIEALKLPTK